MFCGDFDELVTNRASATTGRIERGKTPENPPPPRAVAEALLFFVYSTVAEPPPRPPSREVLASRVAELEAELEATRGSPSGARRPGRNVLPACVGSLARFGKQRQDLARSGKIWQATARSGKIWEHLPKLAYY